MVALKPCCASAHALARRAPRASRDRLADCLLGTLQNRKSCHEALLERNQGLKAFSSWHARADASGRKLASKAPAARKTRETAAASDSTSRCPAAPVAWGPTATSHAAAATSCHNTPPRLDAPVSAPHKTKASPALTLSAAGNVDKASLQRRRRGVHPGPLRFGYGTRRPTAALGNPPAPPKACATTQHLRNQLAHSCHDPVSLLVQLIRSRSHHERTRLSPAQPAPKAAVFMCKEAWEAAWAACVSSASAGVDVVFLYPFHNVESSPNEGAEQRHPGYCRMHPAHLWPAC